MQVSKKIILIILMAVVIGIVLIFLGRESVFPSEKIDYSKYRNELDTIAAIRKNLSEENDIKKVRKAFVGNMTARVFKYWYGTDWDFNGTTQTPQEGSIACGYFVTTTLRDMGVSINRVKMAQCASEEMITSLASKKHIHRFSNVTLADFEKQMNALGTGLYIIGLDNHTGFLHISANGNYFIHASGWYPYKVVKDIVSESSILSKSKYKVVGKISDDENFLRSWTKN